ncbi:MAG: hypothetical protein AUI14_07030 [Actinobacteria bacterium 13_2_20CM_2_71_6]|nr:MAG: hypothetical protein AUI14_07030 [Actinobacteria bacterium 13_2_20CM_2_71_6]
MAAMAERIMVPFDGEGSGVDDLAWGQREIWMAMVRQHNWLPVGGVKRLPAGTTVEEIAEELRYLLSRFQTMRTRLRYDAEGRPSQVVSGSGEIALEVVDADDDADPDEVAEAVSQRYQETDYDFVNEWPVRMAVIRHRGVLTHMAVIMCHLVTDGFGGMVMLKEVEARESAPVAGMQPLEQARWQRSPAGHRQNEAALRYWEGILRAIPPRRFADSTDRREPRHWKGQFTSLALHLASRALVARTRIDSAPVLLAIFAVALARVTGTNPVVTRPIVSNRFRPGLAEVVCPLAQSALCALDVAGISFDEALERTRRAAMVAYKYAYFHPGQLDELISRVAAERGPGFDIACFFNDRRVRNRDGATGSAPTPEDVRAALAHSAFAWVGAQDDPFERLFVHIDDEPDTVHMTIHLDTHYLSPADGEALLRGMETVAVEAALDPAAKTGVAPVPAHV